MHLILNLLSQYLIPRLLSIPISFLHLLYFANLNSINLLNYHAYLLITVNLVYELIEIVKIANYYQQLP
jgi:hypothetical protein